MKSSGKRVHTYKLPSLRWPSLILVAEKGQTFTHPGHPLLFLPGQPFELSLRARPGGTGWSRKALQSAKNPEVGPQSAETNLYRFQLKALFGKNANHAFLPISAQGRFR